MDSDADDEIDPLAYDDALRSLESWLGRTVTVLIGPPNGSGLGGIVWGKLHGSLSKSDANWTPSWPTPQPGVAFQVGPSDESYFVLYPGLFQAAYWVMRDKFFVVEMAHAEVGVEISGLPG